MNSAQRFRKENSSSRTDYFGKQWKFTFARRRDQNVLTKSPLQKRIYRNNLYGRVLRKYNRHLKILLLSLYEKIPTAY